MAEDNFAMGYALGADSGGGRGGGFGGLGDMNGILGLAALGLIFGDGFGNFGNGNRNNNGTCATQADVRAAVDQQTLISKIDQQTYGLADTFTALNNSINRNFRGVDNAICTLGFQNQQGFSNLGAQLASCCCDIERAIDGNTTQGVMNTNSLSRQISDCCCDLEKMNMQNRFDAQAYNNNTLLAIDKLGDRIIGYMSNEKTQALRDENQALRLAASQSAQNQYLINQLRPCPVPAYLTCSPYAASWGTGYNNSGCGCGCGCG